LRFAEEAPPWCDALREKDEPMSAGGRSRARGRILQRTGLLAAVLALVTLLFLLSGHWVLAILFGVPAAVAIWVFFQARSVR
jgi:hypothetical protein